MIIKEFYKIRQDGKVLYRTYSDKNLMIRKVGTDEVYNEAIDLDTNIFFYEETDKEIQLDEFERPINY